MSDSLHNIFDQRRAFDGDASRDHLVLDIQHALKATGFVGFTGLRYLTPGLIAEAKAKSDEMFALPDEVLETLRRPELGGQRGMNMRIGKRKGAEAADNKRYWHQGRRFKPDDPMWADIGDNVPVPQVPGFDTAMLRLYAAFDKELDLTLELFSKALGQPTRMLSNLAHGGDSLMRDLLYMPGTAENAAWGGEHTDSDLITGLTTGDINDEEDDNSLELQLPNGTWTNVRVPRNGFMVNVGDMLSAMTGGRIPSTRHRVGKPKDPTKRRRSTVFFVHPRREKMLTALTLSPHFGEILIPWEEVCAGYALFERLIENNAFKGENPYLKYGRNPSVPPLVSR